MNILAASAPVWVERSLREGFFMFWETLWPLVLGVGLSGAVQAFVSHEQMERMMGDHRPAAVARASGLGMVSSSCSYAATAMAKSLFAKGADFIDAMIFMFASTNLVVELGIVLVILMGWQFAVAEFVGGPIMILLLALTGGLVIGRHATDGARARLQHARVGADERDAMVGVSEERQHELERAPWSAKLRSRAAWADAASYTMADLTMLRKELVIGYLVAGFLTVLVPIHLWNDLFLRGHGFWTSLENVIVGPFIAVVSFVCSVGNVPMAAALWKGGISFGGVISFLFADLITLPLLLIYRKYYGGRLTLRLLAWFWVVMAAAGLLVEGLFSLTGLMPETRPREIVATSFHWNYTTFLNVTFLGLFAYLYWLYRHRERLGGGRGYALDPVCGMQVRIVNAPASADHAGRTVYFCSDRCRERFEAEPDRYTEKAAADVSGRPRDAP
ncbi:MAG: YHS domain-containing protein [Actinobacteria bacterium]|nr:MAG: YHS domain-containing protein [Actinomycetota bacterium]